MLLFQQVIVNGQLVRPSFPGGWRLGERIDAKRD